MSGVPTLPIIPNRLHLTLVMNPGVAFGWLNRHAPVVVVGTCLIILAILFFIWRGQSQRTGDHLPLAFILGGAIGNLIDRVRVGSVIDFIDLRVWPVFNVADSCITIGVAWLLLKAFKRG